MVGDNYKVKLSIKGVERTRRGSTQIHEIRNPSRNTPLPKQHPKMLFNQKNKINISNFIMSDWIRKGEAESEQGRYLYLSGGFNDTERAVWITNGRHTEVDALQSDHEEANSRMFVHTDHAMETFSPERVVLWSIDNDVAIMCPHHVFKCNIAELFFKTGVSERQRFIPMHSVARNLGSTLSAALPVIHALSGCDSTSAFSGIRRKRWLKVASSILKLLKGCVILDKILPLSTEMLEACVELVSLLYTGKLADSLDTIRYKLFSKKNLVSERLLPTDDSFTKHPVCQLRGVHLL